MRTSPRGRAADRDRRAAEARSARIGREALAVGVLANLCAVVPVIGDLITIPLALLAIGLGAWGLGRESRGLAAGAGLATAGLVLGVLAVFVVVALYLVVHV
ncbi:hypothetical protein [Brachybacterium hainanense]|uniref:DUF4190 domain-containing protein n=1 Tax=Brachybacterium hainanense TaxID=1541174 RepID=A0ABV6R9L2_9MICO